MTVKIPYNLQLKTLLNHLPTLDLEIEGEAVAVVYQETAPETTTVLWVDTTDGNNVLKYFDTNIWVSVLNGITASSDQKDAGLESTTNAGGYAEIGLNIALIQGLALSAPDELEVLGRDPNEGAEGENFTFDFGISQLYKNVENLGVNGGGSNELDLTNTKGAVQFYDQHADGTTSVVLGTAAAAYDPSNDKVRTFSGVSRGTVIEFRETSGGDILFTIPTTETAYFLVTAKNAAWNLSKVVQGSGDVTAAGNNAFTGTNTFVDPTAAQQPVTKAYGDANYLGGGGGGGLDITKTVFFDDFLGGVKNADTITRLYTGVGSWQVSVNGSNSIYDLEAYALADSNGVLLMKTDANNNRRMGIYQNNYRLDCREKALNWATRFQMSDLEGGSDRDAVTFASGFVQASTFPTTLTPGNVAQNILGVWHDGSGIKFGVRVGGSDIAVVDAGAYATILNTFREFQIIGTPNGANVDCEFYLDGALVLSPTIPKTSMPDPADDYSPAVTIVGDSGLFEAGVCMLDYFGFEQAR